MPRRHKPTKHTPYRPSGNEKGKVRYQTKQAAEQAAELRMLQHPALTLTVYQGAGGGWYLTRKTHQ